MSAISIIVPAYNAGQFLSECLESISRQSFTDFEVLVINDGSTDATGEIAKKFVGRDKRFRLIETANRGVSAARNTGMDASGSEYLSFVDADDMLHPLALEKMMEAIKENQASVCICNFERDKRHFLKSGISTLDVTAEVYDYREAMRLALYQKRLLNSPWGVVMKRSLVGDTLRFRIGSRYEDLDAFYRFYEKASKIVYIPGALYFYREHGGNFLSNWSADRLDVLDVTDRMADFFIKNYPDLKQAALDRRLSAHFNMLILMKKHHVNNPEAMERCRRVIREGRLKALKDSNVRFKNKVGSLLSFLFI